MTKTDALNQHLNSDGVPLWCQDVHFRRGAYAGNGATLCLFDGTTKYIHPGELTPAMIHVRDNLTTGGEVMSEYHWDVCYTIGQIFGKE